MSSCCKRLYIASMMLKHALTGGQKGHARTDEARPLPAFCCVVAATIAFSLFCVELFPWPSEATTSKHSNATTLGLGRSMACFTSLT